MSWAVWIVLGLVIVGAATWFMRRRAPRVEPPAAEAARAAPQTSDVSTAERFEVPAARRRRHFGALLRPGPNACDAAKALSGKRYLTQEAPVLPLPECDAADCRCQILPLDDRRSGHDRRDSFSAYGDYRPDPDQTWSERVPGRRKED